MNLRFPFRPWVRRTALSILLVAATSTAAVLILARLPGRGYGWVEEPFVWLYLAILWMGGARVFFGTARPVAEILEERIVLRPLHQLKTRSLPWSDILGIEQAVPGDRMIVYFQSRRGMRFVAINLNLVKGRSSFVLQMEEELKRRGFVEKIVERSKVLSRSSERS